MGGLKKAQRVAQRHHRFMQNDHRWLVGNLSPLGIGGTAFAVIGGIRWRGPFANGQLGGTAERGLRIGPEQRLQPLPLSQTSLGLRNTLWLLLSHHNNSDTQPHAKQHSGNRTNREGRHQALTEL